MASKKQFSGFCAAGRRGGFILPLATLALLLWAPAGFAATAAPAEPQDPYALSQLGFEYDNGVNVPRDQRKAAELYSKAAEEGVSFAQFNLARMYESGRGVALDRVEAYKWYTLAGDMRQRDRLAAKMSWFQVAEGKLLASTWKPVAVDAHASDIPDYKPR
jgi:TPR repeat protein